MSNQRLTVEQLIENLFYKTFQRNKDDIYIDKIKEFMIKFMRFVYIISLNETFIRELDDTSNSSRVDSVIKIYLDTEEVSGKVYFCIVMGKTIVVKCPIFVSHDLFKEITSYSDIDSDTPLEFTIVPGIEFHDSAKSKEYILKIYQEHVLQLASRFNISKFKESIIHEYELASISVFVYGIRYITNLYRKTTNHKDTNIIDVFPRNVTTDEHSIKRDDYSIRIYGRDAIIGDHTTWYCKVGFVVNYPGNIYINKVTDLLTKKEVFLSEYMMHIFNELKGLINKDYKRTSFMNTLFTKLLEMSVVEKKSVEEIGQTKEIEETVYFGHIVNKIKELFKCEIIGNELRSSISILDNSSVYSSIGHLLDKGFYSEMYRDINKEIRFLISIYRRTKSPTSPSSMIIIAMDKENNVKFSKIVVFKAKVSAIEGCQFVIYGDINHSYITSVNTINNDKQFYLPIANEEFKKVITKLIGDSINVEECVSYKHEKGKRDPILVVQCLNHTPNTKYLITRCLYGDKYEVIGVYDEKND